MKKYGVIACLCIACLFVTNSGVSQTPEWIWAKSGSSWSHDRCRAVHIDDEENVLVTGYIGGDASFDDSTVISSGSYDFYLAKYNTTGKLLWVRNANCSSVDFGNSVTTDSENNIYVTGNYSETISFDGYTMNNYSSAYDIFITKFNKNGDVIWAKKIGSNGSDESYSIIADKQNNIIVAGSVQTVAYFDSVEISNNDLGSRTLFIAKYNSEGKLIFVKNFGGHLNFAYCSVVDAEGNIIAAGDFDRSIIIGGKSYSTTASSSPIAIKLNENGDVVWVVAPTCTSGYNKFIGAAIGSSGEVFLTGSYNYKIEFGTQNLTNSGNLDGFICAYDSSGTFKWASSFGGNDNDQGNDVCYFGNMIYVTGYQKVLTGKNEDIFINKYDLNGGLKESMIFGSTGEDIGNSICTDKYGNIFLGGYFTSNIAFGTHNLNGQFSEAFIAKYGLSNPPSIFILQQPENEFKCLGDSVVFTISAIGKDLVYQWKHNGINIQDANDTFLNLTNLELSDAGKYSCTITDSSSSLTSDEAVLSIGTGPMITSQPQNKSVEKYKSVTFTITATGNQLTYQWQKNAADIQGATQSFYTISGLQYSDSGVYRCIVHDQCGTDTSSGALLTILHNSGVNNETLLDISTFPNPVHDVLYIDLQEAHGMKFVISVHTIDGKLLLQREINESDSRMVKINTTAFQPGMYLVKICSDSNYRTCIFYKN